MSAESHLKKLGITVPDAFNFIIRNIGNPEIIYNAAYENGVTILMLSQITNFPTSSISEYFLSSDLYPEELDKTSILLNPKSDLGELESLVTFNNNTGALSTTSLKESVQPLLINPSFYDFFLQPVFKFQTNDGIYDDEELGVTHLSNVAATSESIESIFYGTLLDIFSTIDATELNQINSFPEDGNPADLRVLLFDALSDSPTNIAWTNEELESLVTNEAANIINEYVVNDVIGVLDLSFLGLTVA